MNILVLTLCFCYDTIVTMNNYSIGEVAKMFQVNEDTLRNWERRGLVMPDRAGPRKDRVYTQKHIDIITDMKLAKSVVTMNDEEPSTEKMDLTQLKGYLWKSADIMRGKID